MEAVLDASRQAQISVSRNTPTYATYILFNGAKFIIQATLFIK
jgi:hypothetical protein